MAFTGNWMAVPFHTEIFAVGIDQVEEKKVQQPQVMRIAPFKTVECIQPVKKGPPPPGKL
jgi:hypothetical protein